MPASLPPPPPPPALAPAAPAAASSALAPAAPAAQAAPLEAICAASESRGEAALRAGVHWCATRRLPALDLHYDMQDAWDAFNGTFPVGQLSNRAAFMLSALHAWKA